MTTTEQVRALRKAGVGFNQIMRELQLSRTTIYYHLNDKNKNKVNSDNAKRRLARVKKLKLDRGGKCEKCGYHKYIEALEFHHNNPKSKIDGIASLAQHASIAKLIAEAAKCTLLCPNCHREFHLEEKYKLCSCTQDTVKPVS